jgi:type VI protein secretion system component Hcp
MSNEIKKPDPETAEDAKKPGEVTEEQLEAVAGGNKEGEHHTAPHDIPFVKVVDKSTPLL